VNHTEIPRTSDFFNSLLGPYGSDFQSAALGINDYGQAVGFVVFSPGPVPGVGLFNLVVLIALGTAAKARSEVGDSLTSRARICIATRKWS
jgi:hypothetical protein